jgi:UDP-N-acetylglucosamine 2-epimerase (non-hydrolysing)
MNKSYIVLTDSGGIQEEAPSLGKPVLVMREHTERSEGIDAGTAKLVGTDRNLIFNETVQLFNNMDYYKKMSKAVNPYGDGTASKQIADIMESL